MRLLIFILIILNTCHPNSKGIEKDFFSENDTYIMPEFALFHAKMEMTDLNHAKFEKYRESFNKLIFFEEIEFVGYDERKLSVYEIAQGS